MRKLLSILLLVLFSIAPAAPLLALGAGDQPGVPACCRRDGKHHCLMKPVGHIQATGQSHRFGAAPQACPYHPLAPASTHPNAGSLAAARAILAEPARNPAALAGADSRRHAAPAQSSQTRGPPSPLS